MRKKEVYEVTYTNNLGEVDKICVLTDVSISDVIGKIAHHQSESQRHEEAMIDHNDKELALRDQLNEMLAKVGMKAVDIDTEQQEENNDWPDYCDESGIIVDWDSVPYGAKVECIEADDDWFCVGDVTVVQLDECKDLGPISKLKDGLSSYSGVRDGTYKFRLIK